jgi:benzoyl-CoA reductase/2-hydroxyglutaryl-CoA dehydratase subunit BcrC/BadD/HgdB
MTDCCGDKNAKDTSDCPIAWFRDMTNNCLAYAKAGKEEGRHVVGITCEYTPRELIMAAGGMPVCLCGGFAEMIPPAEEFLPANLCPLIKSTYGFSVTKQNPFLEMAELIVAETTCDGKKKMYEMLAQTHPLHMLELPQKPDDPDALEHWVKELTKLKLELEKRFDCEITDEKLNESIVSMNSERALRRELAGLMKDDNPPLTGRELLDMKSILAGMPFDKDQYKKAISELPGRNIDPPASERVRVLITGVPIPHGAERVVDIIEDNGGLVVCQENCTGLKPILEDVDAASADPLRAIAEKYFHLPCSVMTPNTGRFESLRELASEYKPQCVIELIWQACITYDVESLYVKKLCEDELSIPYMRIETDYSPSDSARIATRVEALFETVQARS